MPESTHFLDYWRVLRSRKELVIAIVLMVILAGVLITLFAMPKEYMASTRIAVERSNPDVEIGWETQQFGNPYTHVAFLRTQFEIIQSRTVLSEVIRDFGLVEKLGFSGQPNAEQRVRKYLMRKIKVQLYRDTNLIEIQVYMSRPEENANEMAAAIANKIAEVFRSQREAVKRSRVDRALSAYDDELREQLRRVEKLTGELAEIRKTYGITGVGALIPGSVDSVDAFKLKALANRWVDKVAWAEDRKVLLERVMAMNDSDLMNAQEFSNLSLSLTRLREQKDTLDLQHTELIKSFAEEHPDVKELKAVIAELESKIQAKLSGMRNAIRLNAERAQAEVVALEKQLAALRASDVQRDIDGRQIFNEKSRKLETQRKIAEVLEIGVKRERITGKIPHTIVEVIDSAEAPDIDNPIRPNFLLNLMISILLGLCSGVGIAFFTEYIDTSIRTVEDIERHIGVSVLGIIPQKVLPLIEEGPTSPHAEAYRVIRTNVQFSKRVADEGNSTCVTSGSVGEGKSLTTANLAYITAQLGEKTLIVDSDLRRPRQHRLHDLSNQVGLANILLGEMELDEAILPTSVPNLFLLPSGHLPSAAHGVLNSSRMRDLVAQIKGKFDFSFFDSPPMMGVSDAAVLVSEVDNTLLVIQYRKYPRSVSERAKTLIENVGGNLVGVVLNNINISRDSYYYYYYHTYYSTYQKGAQARGEDATAEQEVRY